MPFEVAAAQIKNLRSDILNELRKSIERNTAVGIFTKDSRELITTAVKEIAENTGESEDCIIELMGYDLHGFPLTRNKILLSNIDRVIHFSIRFDDPVYVRERRKETFKV